MKELLFAEEDATLKTSSPSGSGRNSPSISSGGSKKTDAERRFEEVKKERVSLTYGLEDISIVDSKVVARPKSRETSRQDSQGPRRGIQ